METTMKKIVAEIANVMDKMNEQDVEAVAHRLEKAPRIFVIGEGRSGLMARAFAMRLMHLGATSYVIGETITPSIEKGDILVAISGSGRTHHVVWTAQKAKEQGVFVQALTTNPEGDLAKTADAALIVPAATKFRREGEAPSIQPLGSLFDQSTHIVFDAICLKYAEAKQISQQAAFQKHSNLES
ncbi:6-phospho-3-hexuloisomerase [uncultured Mitsuokella sp.]|uniref:6-phospho-3-hexuloisomerase n=1 Tax=uncultured Mitsuokella sp. TaxID=453120 RepID=UPI0025F98AA7|nr:6-phospho-3-hexuloisomerase [uncultured Mitsuokella sp.]